MKPLGSVFVFESVLAAQHFWRKEGFPCESLLLGWEVFVRARMLWRHKAAPVLPEGVAVPGTRTLGAVPGTPMPPAGPGTPGIGDPVDTGKSPSQQAATSPPASPKGEGDEVVEVPEASERVSKKQRIEQTQEAVVQLTGLMKTTLEGLQALHETLKLNTENQQEMKAEIDALAKQMGQDAVTTKVVYSSLS